MVPSLSVCLECFLSVMVVMGSLAVFALFYEVLVVEVWLLGGWFLGMECERSFGWVSL
jgi:hypothetical protein